MLLHFCSYDWFECRANGRKYLFLGTTQSVRNSQNRREEPRVWEKLLQPKYNLRNDIGFRFISYKELLLVSFLIWEIDGSWPSKTESKGMTEGSNYNKHALKCLNPHSPKVTIHRQFLKGLKAIKMVIRPQENKNQFNYLLDVFKF